jgi:hypothetical protein
MSETNEPKTSVLDNFFLKLGTVLSLTKDALLADFLGDLPSYAPNLQPLMEAGDLEEFKKELGKMKGFIECVFRRLGYDLNSYEGNKELVNLVTSIFATAESQVGGRDVVFRRARMPIWYNNDYQPVLPSSQLLAVKKDENGKTIPRYIYEEEIQGYGTKVGLYPQRTRWFNGTSFTWLGYEKKISGTQANSGLMFDALLEVEKKKEE